MYLSLKFLAPLFVVASTSIASAITVDFSALTPGSAPTSIVIGGVTIDFSVASNGSTNELRVLDTNSSSPNTGAGNDPDLRGPFDDANDGDTVTDRLFANALIIQEHGTAAGEIDDEVEGGSIFVSFTYTGTSIPRPITLTNITMLDTDSTASLFVNGGSTAVASGSTVLHGLPNDGPNQWLGFDVNETNVTTFEIALSSSGALGEFSFDAPPPTVPVPAGLPLAAAGLGALAVLRRRTHRQA